MKLELKLQNKRLNYGKLPLQNKLEKRYNCMLNSTYLGLNIDGLIIAIMKTVTIVKQ